MLEEKSFKNEFLKLLLNDHVWINAKNEFNHLFINPLWVVVDKLDKDNISKILKENKLSDSCVKKALDLFIKAAKSSNFQECLCDSTDTKDLVFPISIEEKNYGYIGLIHLNKEVSFSLIKLLKYFVEGFALRAQKNLELERLYETIGPRTLALSTIHTLHRAMSSNLNLDELLPRIGRLSLQVLGAAVCKIYLFDNKKKEFSLKVNIDLKNINRKSKKIRADEEIVNKVAKSSLSILRNDLIAVPLVEDEVLGVVIISRRSSGKPFTYFDQDILSTLSEQAVIAIKNARLFEQQERLTIGSIRSIASLLKIKESEWHFHTPVFKTILLQLAAKMKVSKEENTALQQAALLHDIEKASIPDKILKKNKPLTQKEYRVIEKHPLKTIKILKPLHSLEPAIPIILHHHERYDGKGYPSRLQAEQIPLGARIMAVVEAFEAMITVRPWRAALKVEDAIAEIKRNSGTQFDPVIVEAFLKIIKDPKISSKIKKRNQKD
ncbi:MAG: HD domain-containing phosphohydrolase [Candidatus Omnitrophota bacterium]